MIQQDILEEIGQRLAGKPIQGGGAPEEEELKYEEYDDSPRSRRASKQMPRRGTIRISMVSPADADNGLSYTDMIKVVEARHPRVMKNGKSSSHSCCTSQFGWHCMCRSWRKSDIQDLGVGISAYFKILKFMTVLFLWFSFLSIPAFLFYTTGNRSAV